MRERLDDSERMYIKEKILQPMEQYVQKITLFGTLDRAKIMLETSIRGLPYDREKFNAGVLFEGLDGNRLRVSILGKHKECDEICRYEQTFTMPSY